MSVAVAVTVANDFTILPSPGSPAAATISAGGTATYLLNVAGFTGSVSFTCAGVPQESVCTVSPNPANISGQSATAVTVSVKTTSRLLAGQQHSRKPFQPVLWAFALLPGIVLLQTASAARTMRRHLMIAAACFALAVCVACGGGGSRSSLPPTASGTPAGTYTITVAATAGTSTHSFDLKLTVN